MTQRQNPQKQIPRLHHTPHASTTTTTSPSKSSSSRWQAVSTRDPTATTFVYAVKTTKIYCRPSCPSRLARRANVDFYDTPRQAERAGFRPCKRCKPETLEPVVDRQVQVVQNACRTIRADVGVGVRPTLLKLAGEAGLTPSHFHRVFRRVMGVPLGRYVDGILGSCRGQGERGDGGGVNGNDELGLDLDSLWLDSGLFQPFSDPESFFRGGLDVLDESVGYVGADYPVNNNNSDAVLWNDFDVLIAAEAGSDALQDLYPLAGNFPFSDSDSPASGVVGGC